MNTEKSRLSKTIFGALNLRNRRFYWKQSDKGTSQYFIQFLHQLHRSHPDKILTLIIDNGSIHKSRQVKRFVAKHRWIEIYYLPPYSPEYNPVERFWNWMKKKVYGCKSFNKIETLIQKIRKLIWHYNERNMVSAIQFNFNLYRELL